MQKLVANNSSGQQRFWPHKHAGQSMFSGGQKVPPYYVGGLCRSAATPTGGFGGDPRTGAARCSS